MVTSTRILHHELNLREFSSITFLRLLFSQSKKYVCLGWEKWEEVSDLGLVGGEGYVYFLEGFDPLGSQRVAYLLESFFGESWGGGVHTVNFRKYRGGGGSRSNPCLLWSGFTKLSFFWDRRGNGSGFRQPKWIRIPEADPQPCCTHRFNIANPDQIKLLAEGKRLAVRKRYFKKSPGFKSLKSH